LSDIGAATGSLPTAEDIEMTFAGNFENRSSDLTLEVTCAGWIIKGIILNNEQVFKDKNGSHMQIASVSSNKITVALKSDKNSKQLIDSKIILG
jgi:hypothetical protein